MNNGPRRIVRPLRPLAPSQVRAFVGSTRPLPHRPSILLERWNPLRRIVLASPHPNSRPLKSVGELLVTGTAAPCQVFRFAVGFVPIEVHHPKVLGGTAQDAAPRPCDVLLCPIPLRPVRQVALNLWPELNPYQHGAFQRGDVSALSGRVCPEPAPQKPNSTGKYTTKRPGRFCQPYPYKTVPLLRTRPRTSPPYSPKRRSVYHLPSLRP